MPARAFSSERAGTQDAGDAALFCDGSGVRRQPGQKFHARSAADKPRIGAAGDAGGRPEDDARGGKFRTVPGTAVMNHSRVSFAGLVLAGILLTFPFASAASEPKLETKIAVNEEVGFTAFSPDGKIAGVLKSNKIGIWSVADGRQIQMVEFGAERPEFVDFLNNGTQLVVGLRNGKIQLHNVETGKILRSLDNGAPPRVVRVSRDGRLLAAAGGDREVHLWDLATGKLVHKLGLELGGAADLAFAPDGKWLYGGSGDHAIHVIDAGSGKIAKSFPAQKVPVIALAISPDGKRIMAVYRDANEPNGNTPILLWSTESGQVLR